MGRRHPGIIGLLVAALASTAAPAQTTSSRTAGGALTYLARIALPPEAIALVEARGADGALLAEARIATEGRQVPIPFALDLPAGMDVMLGAAIAHGGQPLWVSGELPLAAEASPGEILLSPFPDVGFAHVLRCGSDEIALTLATEAVVLAARGGRLLLAQVPAASGARYEAPGDPATFVWLKGASAIASLSGEALGECVMGVPRAEPSLRARGNEPGWSLEIAGGQITLVTAYGAERRKAAQPVPAIEDGAIVYRLADPETVIRISDALCRDDATGMPHPRSVSIGSAGAELRGCGGDAVELLAGPEWVVEDIGGAGVIDSARVTLEFMPSDATSPGPSAEGRLAGSGGCNRYNAGFTLTGEGLSVGPAAATMMACAEALMGLEQAFFMVLDKVAGFDIDSTGALVLKAADGQALVRARRG